MKHIVIALAALSAGWIALTAQEETKKDEAWAFLEPGFGKLLEKKYGETMGVWLAGSALKERHGANLTSAVEGLATHVGDPTGYRHVRTLAISDRVEVVTAVVHHERAAIYFSATLFRTSEGKRVLTEIEYRSDLPYVPGVKLEEEKSGAWKHLKPILEQLVAGKHEEAFRKCIEGGPIGEEAVGKLTGPVAQVEGIFGKAKSCAYVTSFWTGPRSEILFAATYHEKGAFFLQFHCYRIDGKWTVHNIRFNTDLRNFIQSSLWQVK